MAAFKLKVLGGNVFIMTKAKIEEELAKTGGTVASGSTAEWWNVVLDLNFPISDVNRFEDDVLFTLRKKDTVVDITFNILDEHERVLTERGIDKAWRENLEDHTTDAPKLNVHFHWVDGIKTPDENGDVHVNVVIIHLERETAVVVQNGRIIKPTPKTISEIQKNFKSDATPVERLIYDDELLNNEEN